MTVNQTRLVSEPKHSPAPWDLSEWADKQTIGVEHAELGDIADVVICRTDRQVDLANARLVQSAPDLALLLEAAIHFGLRWQADGYGSTTGHVYFAGRSYASRIGELGTPEMTPDLRLALQRARAAAYITTGVAIATYGLAEGGA